MDMSALNIFWYLGIALCAIYMFLYAKDAIALSAKKKKSVLVKAAARTCTIEKKWAYNATNVKYEYTVNGELRKGTRCVKSVLRPNIKQGMQVDAYYEKENDASSFLAEEIKSNWRNVFVLLVLAAILCTTLFFGM